MSLSPLDVQMFGYCQGPSARPPMFCEPSLVCPANFPNVGTPAANIFANSFTVDLVDHSAGLLPYWIFHRAQELTELLAGIEEAIYSVYSKDLLSSSERPSMNGRPTSTFPLVSFPLAVSLSHKWNPSLWEEPHLFLLLNPDILTIQRHG